MHLLKPSYRTLIITHARFFCSFQLEIMLDLKYLFAYGLFLISKLLLTPAITFFIKQLKKEIGHSDLFWQINDASPSS